MCLLLAVVASGLLGCAVADLYGGRATVYNVESERAHNQGLLLNIVRASLRHPRQFTIVQKITGSATAQGTANLTFPFGPNASSSFSSGMLTGQASGGPSFEVPTLETSDFFSGLLQPIDARLLDLYIHGQFPPDLILNLFIEKIVLRRTDGPCAIPILRHEQRCEITLQNYPGVDVQLDLYQALIAYLIDIGLSSEAAAAAPKKAAPKKKKAKDDSDGGDDSGGDTAGAHKFCFAPAYPDAVMAVRGSDICGSVSRRAAPAKGSKKSALGTILINRKIGDVLEQILNRYRNADNNEHAFEPLRGFVGKAVSLEIYTRSTETEIYYVGEVVRRELYPDYEKSPRQVEIKLGPPFDRMPYEPCRDDEPPSRSGWACVPLFVLEQNAGANLAGDFAVNYEGTRYAIPDEPGAGARYGTRAGASYTVLTILRQLVIMNTNLKSLPATNVLTTRTQ